MRRLLILAACAAIGCDDGDSPVDPGAGTEAGTITVDAAAGWGFLAFDGDAAELVTVAEPGASSDWTMAFNATAVMLNGGAAGPGGVEGWCVCQNEGATDAQLIAMTPASELADFDAVTAAPATGEAWVTDALAPAIDGWYAYDPVAHVVSADPAAVFAVRTASGTSFAKLHVLSLAGSTQAHAGEVTFEYALQPTAGATFAAPETTTVDVSAGSVHFDLESGAATTGDDWDLWLEGYDIRLNGGVSGDGMAGAYLTGEAFASVDDASGASAGAYAADAFGGVFDAHRWYRYNLEGSHQIWPTYDVYLIRRGADVYKVQLTGYYGATGDARQITVRYARVAPQ